jgi:hypothetical protein
MESELVQFYRAAIDRTFRPRLDAFLKKWEENFAPYVNLKFTYRINGQHLDISATIPEPARYVINFIHRNYRRRIELDPSDPLFKFV